MPSNGPRPDRKPGAKPPEKQKELGAAEALEVIGEQRLTPEERALMAEAYSRLEIWGSKCQEYHENARKARLVYRLRDPDQDAPSSKRKILQLQTLKSTLNNCIADQMDNMPEAFMVPQIQELSSVATEMNNTVQFIMEQNDYVTFHQQRATNFLIEGTSVTQVMWDPDMNYGKGDVSISVYPIDNIVWDPQATEVQDARAMMKLSWHPLSWFAEHYPGQAMYVEGDEGTHGSLAMSSLVAQMRDDTEDRALLVEYWYRRYDAKRRRYAINVAFLAGGALLEVYEDVYAHGMYPFIFDVYSRIHGTMVGEGLVAELTPMMRYINRYADYIDNNLRYSSKARMLTRRGAGIDLKQLADWNSNIVEGDDISEEQGVRWFETKPFTSMVTQQLYQFQSDMKMDSGQSQFSRGETTGGVDAASAIQLLQNAGSKITRLRTQTLNAGFKKAIEQVLWLVAEFYTDERSALISGPNLQPIPVRMGAEHLMGRRQKGHMDPPPYTVQIKIQRLNPAAVQAQNDLYIQAYTMAAEHGQVFPLTALFQLLNVDGKDRVLPVLEQSDMMTQQMQVMAAENEQLRAQVQNLNTSLDSYAQSLTSDVSDLQGEAFGEGESAVNTSV